MKQPIIYVKTDGKRTRFSTEAWSDVSAVRGEGATTQDAVTDLKERMKQRVLTLRLVIDPCMSPNLRMMLAIVESPNPQVVQVEERDNNPQLSFKFN